MYLELGLKIIYDERVRHFYLQDYKSNISSDGYSFAFGLEDFNKVSHALKVFNEEFVEAVKRADERLLAEGFDKNSFQIPLWKRKEREEAKDSDKTNMNISQFPTDLHDKNGEVLHEDDVIYDGKNHYHIYWNELHPQVEGFSPICGYIHNLTQKELSLFVRVGTMNEIQDWCDERL